MSDFAIDSMEKADWALGKIAEAKAEIEKNNAYAEKAIAQFKERIAKIESWAQKVNGSAEHTIEHMQTLLVPYLDSEIANAKGKKRSVKLPNGTIGYRKHIKVEKNDEVLLAFAKESYPEFVKTKEYLDWSGLKAKCKMEDSHFVTADGEVLPTATYEEVDDIYLNVEPLEAIDEKIFEVS